MDLCNRITSKPSQPWTDIQKQLISVLQTRNIVQTSTTTTTSSAPKTITTINFNKLFVRQCTDLLIKHITSTFYY
jgi:hypothetical protein